MPQDLIIRYPALSFSRAEILEKIVSFCRKLNSTFINFDFSFQMQELVLDEKLSCYHRKEERISMKSIPLCLQNSSLWQGMTCFFSYIFYGESGLEEHQFGANLWNDQNTNKTTLAIHQDGLFQFLKKRSYWEGFYSVITWLAKELEAEFYLVQLLSETCLKTPTVIELNKETEELPKGIKLNTYAYLFGCLDIQLLKWVEKIAPTFTKTSLFGYHVVYEPMRGDF